MGQFSVTIYGATGSVLSDIQQPEDIIEKFDGRDKMICNTLLSWVNDGSHFAIDDLHMTCDAGQVERYLNVFQRIFEESEHGGHFKMMMGDDYVALPIASEAEAQQIVVEAAALAANANVATTDSAETMVENTSGGSEGAASNDAP